MESTRLKRKAVKLYNNDTWIELHKLLDKALINSAISEEQLSLLLKGRLNQLPNICSNSLIRKELIN
ncbi:hypothetical protein Syn6312_1354 [Synechococcus sp. PCC 6312]|nr:hypothetical protein Syn6312_1354 [Synechococcus sp. PCC 6312]